MRIAIVGCGYVADFYLKTLANHPQLELLGVMDRDRARAARFGRFHQQRTYATLAELLDDPRVELVVNLTNPDSHYEVSRAALLAGKHVYSEKPLAMDFGQAQELVSLAAERGLGLAAAPCNVLGESAQTVWKALREGAVGTPRLAYAELDDGPVHLMDYRSWVSASGAPWPYRDEFQVGCTLEHAGYYLTWLCAFFGPVKRVTSFSALLVPDKGVALARETPDFSVGLLEFEGGQVARLTSSIFAPHEHGLTLSGDRGVLHTDESWDYASPVLLSGRGALGLRAEKHPRLARALGLGARKLPLVRKPSFQYRVRGAHRMDMARGIAELADSISERRPCRLGPELSLHVNELVLTLQHPERMGSPRVLTTRFPPMEPMPWAR